MVPISEIIYTYLIHSNPNYDRIHENNLQFYFEEREKLKDVTKQDYKTKSK